MSGETLSLVIPAYNEEMTICIVLDEAAREFSAAGLARYELLVVDDGSTDETRSRAQDWARAHPAARVLHHAARKGLGESLRTGFASATLDTVTWLPGDGQFAPGDSLRLLRALGDADIIVGDVAPSRRVKADSVGRLILSRGLRLLMHAASRQLVTYTGLVLFRRRILDGVPLTGRTGIVNFELINKAAWRGAAIRRADFHVEVRARRAGQSKVANIPTVAQHLQELGALRSWRRSIEQGAA